MAPHTKPREDCRDVVEENLVLDFLSVSPLLLNQLRGRKESPR